MRLFEMEVPEIYEGIVEIRARYVIRAVVPRLLWSPMTKMSILLVRV